MTVVVTVEQTQANDGKVVEVIINRSDPLLRDVINIEQGKERYFELPSDFSTFVIQQVDAPMDFAAAAKALNQRKKVKRKTWGETTEYLFATDWGEIKRCLSNERRQDAENYSFLLYDLVATDWVVVE